ncbi:CBS domain-containing protein [candidate division KSB1 bacterium]|nr:CBS domain-containing protein [candidate division KSB1 bacterium]MCH8871711.1 CBS domain-containing protein [candidate division KSB1 bacterium]MCH8956249.1 CBS domain-containing protein [candidate division KSB1 bacterium]MCH8980616.1 CBS domain-containing protein [candidate division KSB1 bacterium]
MGELDFQEFDDELQSMEELMDEAKTTLSDKSLKVPLKSLNLKKAVVVAVGTSLKKCIEKMLARHFGCLLVVKDTKYCGIFTERDVLLRVAGMDLNLETSKIEDFMTPDAVQLEMEDTIETALRLMVKGGYRHICIVDEKDHPLSLVSIKDIVSFIVEFFPQDVLNLPPHPIRIGTKNREGG